MVKLATQATLSVSFVILGFIIFWWCPKEETVSITLLFVEFEAFANNVSATCSALGTFFPSLLVVSDTLPYPPLKLTPPARLHVTAPGIGTPLLNRVPADLVTTSHVLLLPDYLSFSDTGRVAALASARPAALLALPAGSVTCERLRFSLRQWTLQYSVPGAGEACDSVAGPHALLMPAEVLWQLSDPFCRPSPECLYVQTKHAGLKVEVADSVLLTQTSGPASPRQRDKLRQHRRHHRAQFYRWAGVRRVWRGGRWRWHGCTRHTPRCFPSIVDDTPAYLYDGRWTPPCCLRHLRHTARHVFAALRRCRARFWLEGGSLLGAVRNSDIIPWDSDVDIGIYQEDIPGCPYLHAAVKGAVSDPDGFVWEKAPEGRFFRVQYSVANRVHVDVFPFYSNNGTMTKDTWFETHPQDCEFPEHYLRPLETLRFVGVNVTVPNNAREFLELKFGKGVIETPQYPMPDRIPFPAEIETTGAFYGEETFPGSEDDDSELSTH